MVLGEESYKTALNLLTETVVNGGLLTRETIKQYIDDSTSRQDENAVSIKDVLYTLEHDGYLVARGNGYQFVSGLLEDWWRARHSAHFTPIGSR